MLHQHLQPRLNAILNVLTQKVHITQDSILLEDTGGRGYHIWLFLSQPILGSLAVAFGNELKRFLDFDFEFFPKQGRITSNRKFGSLIKLPLGLHRAYHNARSQFFTVGPEGPVFYQDLQTNLKHLHSIKPIDSLIISEIAETYQGELLLQEAVIKNFREAEKRPYFTGNPDYLISNCLAMKNIVKKAQAGEQLSFAESFHFTNTLLSVEGGLNEVHRIIKLSYKEEYNPKITNDRID